MVEIKYHILPSDQLSLYNKLKKANWLKPFYLAGGTALALQLGHRISNDFDFFSDEEFDNDQIVSLLEQKDKFIRLSEARNTLHGQLKNIRVSFIRHHYPILGEMIGDDFMKLASLKDIACMKLSAVNSRGTKKDFVDIYFLLKLFSLKDMISLYEKKYHTEFYEYMITKSLLWFEDAETDPMPNMIENISWEEVKKVIISAVRTL
jgi:hypothetical protein